MFWRKQKEIEALQAKAKDLRKSLEDYLNKLKVE